MISQPEQRPFTWRKNVTPRCLRYKSKSSGNNIIYRHNNYMRDLKRAVSVPSVINIYGSHC